MEDLLKRTAERLAAVNIALMNEDEAVSREMIERFAGCAQCYLVIISVLILCRILIDNVLEPSKMSKRETWKKILDSEEDKKKMADIFVRIDEHTKKFHVRSLISQPTKILMPCSSAQTHANHLEGRS
jgi:hypothetical protein